MIKTNFVFYTSKIIIELVEDLLYFPIWWYSKGLWQVILGVQRFLSDKLKSLALLVWIKNLFVPMFGQEDFAGRLISFFIRFFQIIGRSLVFVCLAGLSFLLLLLWILGPIYIVYQIIWQIF